MAEIKYEEGIWKIRCNVCGRWYNHAAIAYQDQNCAVCNDCWKELEEFITERLFGGGKDEEVQGGDTVSP